MAAPGADPGGNPDDLLMQIRALLDQYLAMGGDTPVAPEVQALAQAIDATAGAAGAPPDQGAPPPGGPPLGDEGLPLVPGGQPGVGDEGLPIPDMTGGGDQGYTDFGSANAGLLEDMMKKKSKGR